MRFRIAVISDIHDAVSCASPARLGQFGQTLALKVVHRLNRWEKPDAVLILGDCIDEPNAPDALERLSAIKASLDLLDAPYIIIPGNHDPRADVFYSVMPRPGEHVDIGKVRFVPFLDAEAPGWHATRSAADLQRMRQCRGDHDGPLVLLQHVPAMPPGESDVAFNYTNIEDVMDGMRACGATLTVGGHYHPGWQPVRRDGSAYLCAPGLCESPFQYTLIDLDDEKPGADANDIDVTFRSLRLDDALGIVDYHSHTQFAYCSENMAMDRSPELARAMGVRVQTFTEHSGQLYFDRPTFWSAGFAHAGVDHADGRDDRMTDYWRQAHTAQRTQREEADRYAPLRVGLEVDTDFQGRLVVDDADRARAQIINAAVHFLPQTLLPPEQRDAKRMEEQFMAVMTGLVAQRPHIIAHPFRIFRKPVGEKPEHLFEPVVKLLKAHGVAAEINCHINTPDPTFVRLCIDAGVKLTLGSDAHNLYEVGEFTGHLRVLEQAGYDGDLGDILADFSQVAAV